MVAFVLVCVPIAMLSISNELTAVALLQDNDSVQAMIFLGLYKNGMMIAEIFMGLWLFPLGWLFYQSGFVPKTLGILLMLGCFAYLVDACAGLVMPDWQTLTKQGVMLPALAELATVFWLPPSVSSAVPCSTRNLSPPTIWLGCFLTRDLSNWMLC